jgi:hypothetical protein
MEHWQVLPFEIHWNIARDVRVLDVRSCDLGGHPAIQ